MTIEKLNVKDEQLQGEVRYRVKDSNGNVVYESCTIEMITELLQEGTELNKVLFDKIDTNFENIKTKIGSIDTDISNANKKIDDNNTATNNKITTINTNINTINTNMSEVQRKLKLQKRTGVEIYFGW